MPAHSLTRLVLLAVLSSVCAPLAASAGESSSPKREEPSASSLLSKLPLSFIENRGQVPNEEVSHYAQTPSGAIGFTSTGLRIGLSDSRGTSQQWSLAMDFLGGSAQPQASERMEGVISYFTGDRKDWHTNLPTYSRITYRDLWEGIDLVYRADGPKLKYEFVVHPGADPADIRLRWRGASEVSRVHDGSLRVQTPAGSLTDGAPVSFQGDRRVQTSYALAGTTVGFLLGEYDPTRTLVIDPVLTLYAGYIGGAGTEIGYGIAVDSSGAAYVTGSTDSTAATFPDTVGPYLTKGVGTDAFVAKVNPGGTDLVYAGYIGGDGTDYGNGIAVDPSGAAYLTGFATSDVGFPATLAAPFAYGGGGDAFVAKVSPGGALSYAGYIGGDLQDIGYGIAVDPSGAAYVTGNTDSAEATFPVTAGGPDPLKGVASDAFVAKVNPGATAFSYAGYIGGDGYDFGHGIAVDSMGAAYVTGGTDSDAATFPVTGGPDLIKSAGGDSDAFVAKVNPGGTAFSYAGYIGGDANETGYGIAVDPSGAAYVTGITGSTAATFPETVGPFLTKGAFTDAFVAKVNPGGTALSYAGYIGGDGGDGGNGIAVDSAGAAYLTGSTTSDAATFPETVGPFLTNAGGIDAFVAKVNPGGTALTYAGYIGGSGTDVGEGIAVDASGAAYLTGNTTSDAATFPETVGPFLTNAGGTDAFVAKVDNLCLGKGVTIQGTVVGETIPGTPGDDVIQALGGNDTINGGGGNDVICGGDGTDTLSFAGGAGVVADLVLGTATGQGADSFTEIENLTGSTNKDTLRGSPGGNVILGGGGADRLLGRGGKDRLSGGGGKDRLSGGGGKDRLSGGGGKDRLSGGGGKDRLSGGGANDRLSGGGGADRLNGGAGNSDRCNGGAGTDTASNCESVTGVP